MIKQEIFMNRIIMYSLLALSLTVNLWADRLMDPNETESAAPILFLRGYDKAAIIRNTHSFFQRCLCRLGVMNPITRRGNLWAVQVIDREFA